MALSAEDLDRMVEDHDRLLVEMSERLTALEEEVKRVLGVALDDDE